MGEEEVTSRKWNRVIFSFNTDGDTWEIRGVLRSLRRMARAIFASLPIRTEALVFNKGEILIELGEDLKGEFSRDDRTHRAEGGSIIYRPQLPGISLFSDYAEIYEPVEKLGEIQRDSLETLQEVSEQSKAVMFCEIESGEE